MEQVQDHLEMPELGRDFGTQTYEQQVVELSKTGEKAWESPALGGGAQPLGAGPGRDWALGACPL